jgi:hypothetical protein
MEYIIVCKYVERTFVSNRHYITEILLKVALNTIILSSFVSGKNLCRYKCYIVNSIQLLPALKVNNYDVHRQRRQ